jgi:hypothetical protein
MTPNLQYRDCPLTFEKDTAPKYLQGQWNRIDDTHGSITTVNNKYLTVNGNGSYGESDTVGQWQTFEVLPQSNLLLVHSAFALWFRVPYCAL